jgi:hypothetical protein
MFPWESLKANLLWADRHGSRVVDPYDHANYQPGFRC